MVSKIHKQLRKGAARVILCGALAVSAAASTACSSSAASDETQETRAADAEGTRLFKYRTLRALNTLRDMGLTPQGAVDALSGLRDNEAVAEATDDAAGRIQQYTSDVGQDIADTVTEQTQAAVRQATDAATDVARREMSNWVDSLGRSIGSAIREFAEGIMSIGAAE